MAGVWLLPILIFLGLFGLSCMVVFILIWLLREGRKITIQPNASIIHCHTRKQFTNGYVEGLIKTQLLRKNGLTFFEFYPTDSEQGEGIPLPELQSFVADENMVRRFPKGELSSNREIVKILPRSPADIPKNMRDTDEGKWMTKEGQLAHLQTTFGKAIPAGDEAINEQMNDWARGEISRGTMAQIKEENAQARKLYTPKQEDSPQNTKK